MMPMDYGRNKKIHGFSKKSHNCNPCAQHSNTYQRGLKLKHERGNPSKPPLMPPLLAVGGSADNKIWEQLQKHHPKGGVFFADLALTAVSGRHKITSQNHSAGGPPLHRQFPLFLEGFCVDITTWKSLWKLCKTQ